MPQTTRARADHERAFTASTWALLLCMIGVLLAAAGGLWILSAHLRSSPSASDVAERFLRGVADADAEAWRPLLSTPLARRAAETGGTPLIGDPVLRDVMELSLTADAPRTVRAADPQTTVAEEDADTAIFPAQLIYTPDAHDDSDMVTVDIELVLSRSFAYDHAEAPVPARAGAQPTAVGPWRVSGFTPSEDPSAGMASEMPRADACTTPIAVLVDLSDAARIDGEISTDCALSGLADAVQLDDRADPAEWASAFPVLTDAHPIPELLWSAPRDASLVAYRLETARGPLIALITRQDDDERVRSALIALRPMSGAS